MCEEMEFDVPPVLSPVDQDLFLQYTSQDKETKEATDVLEAILQDEDIKESPSLQEILEMDEEIPIPPPVVTTPVVPILPSPVASTSKVKGKFQRVLYQSILIRAPHVWRRSSQI